MEEYTGAVRRSIDGGIYWSSEDLYGGIYWSSEEVNRWRNILEQWRGSIDGGIYWSSEEVNRWRNILEQ